MEMLTMIVVAAVAFVVGLFVGHRRGRQESVPPAAEPERLRDVAEPERAAPGAGAPAAAEARLEELARLLASDGDLPTDPSGLSPAEAQVMEALQRGWVRRGQEREEAVEAALGRLSAFLQVAIENPLQRAQAALSRDAMRDGVEDALGAIVDLEFFLEDPPEGGGEADLRRAVTDVVDEFEASWPDLTVRRRVPEEEIPVRMNADALKDALFLVLHNAAVFGPDGPIDVTLEVKGHRAEVYVRDKGPGFTPDALASAFDPFYSTSQGGLGMGLPQAKRLVEGQGGVLRIRNMRKGGAEVRASLPLSS